MKLNAAIEMLRARVRLRRWTIGPRVRLGRSVRFSPPRDSRVTLGRKVKIGAGCHFQFRYEGETIPVSIGENTYLQGGSEFHIARGLTIGRDCAISWGVQVLGTDYHEIRRPDGIRRPVSLPVEIGDRVLIGSRVTILKGAKIGSGSVVGAGSVVRGTFPPNSLIMGNPAVRVGEVEEWCH